MAGIGANYSNHALPADDLAMLAESFDRCANFHVSNVVLRLNTAFRQIVRRYFHNHFVPRRKARNFRTRFERHVRQKSMPIRQFHEKQSVFQHFHYRAFNLNGIFSRHVKISGSDPVINTVCSKWADSEPSWVTAVQLSFKVFTPGAPALTIGSIASVMPGTSSRF